MAEITRCEDIMTRSPRSLQPHHTLLDAIKLMKEIDVGYVPVLAENEHRLVGVLTDRDIALRLSDDTRPSQRRIADVMTRDPVTCRPDDNILDCASVMEDHQFRRVPVVDEDNILLGVVSVADIVRRAAPRKELEAEIPALISAVSAAHHRR
jgi:CBS domain-containing protein